MSPSAREPKLGSSSVVSVRSRPSKADISSSSAGNEMYVGNPFDTLGRVGEEINLRSHEILSSISQQKRGNAISEAALKKKAAAASTAENTNEPEKPVFMRVAGYLSYLFLFVVGYTREFLYGTGPIGPNVRKIAESSDRAGYKPLYAGFESFYIRNVYRRLKDVFNRPGQQFQLQKQSMKLILARKRDEVANSPHWTNRTQRQREQ